MVFYFLPWTITSPRAHMNVISQMLCEWWSVIRVRAVWGCVRLCEACSSFFFFFFFSSTPLQRTSRSWRVLMPKPVTRVIPALFVNIECTLLLRVPFSILYTPFLLPKCTHYIYIHFICLCVFELFYMLHIQIWIFLLKKKLISSFWCIIPLLRLNPECLWCMWCIIKTQSRQYMLLGYNQHTFFTYFLH